MYVFLEENGTLSSNYFISLVHRDPLVREQFPDFRAVKA